MFEARTYRKKHLNSALKSFEVSYLETDLWIGTDQEKYSMEMKLFALNKIKELRSILIGYHASHHNFLSSYTPLKPDSEAPAVIQKMLRAGMETKTGPMSCVAGIFAEYVGEALSKAFHLNTIIVENGGDNYVKSNNLMLTIPIHLKDEELDNKIGIQITASDHAIGICTSSGKMGHSFSFGKADTVTVISKNISLADAFATSICNQVQSKFDLESIMMHYGNHPDITTLVLIIDGSVGIMGEHEIVFV